MSSLHSWTLPCQPQEFQFYQWHANTQCSYAEEHNNAFWCRSPWAFIWQSPLLLVPMPINFNSAQTWFPFSMCLHRADGNLKKGRRSWGTTTTTTTMYYSTWRAHDWNSTWHLRFVPLHFRCAIETKLPVSWVFFAHCSFKLKLQWEPSKRKKKRRNRKRNEHRSATTFCSIVGLVHLNNLFRKLKHEYFNNNFILRPWLPKMACGKSKRVSTEHTQTTKKTRTFFYLLPFICI